MHRTFLVSAALLTSCALVAGAQNPAPGGGIKLSDVVGTWDSKASVGPTDSVTVTSVASVITATADGKSWSMKFPSGNPVPVRVVAVGGDSVVTEAGPYPSMLRPGQTVTLLRTVGHYKGDTMTGTFEAQYTTGTPVHGTVKATRKK